MPRFSTRAEKFFQKIFRIPQHGDAFPGGAAGDPVQKSGQQHAGCWPDFYILSIILNRVSKVTLPLIEMVYIPSDHTAVFQNSFSKT